MTQPTNKKKGNKKMTLNNIYLIKEGGQVARLGSYYYEAQQEGKNDLFKTTKKEKAPEQELNAGVFPIIKKNQINKHLRENESFLFRATFQAWDKKQTECVYDWDDKYDLYLSSNDIIKIEEQEEQREMRRGCVEYLKNYYFILSRPLFLASAYDLYIYKTWEEIPQNLQKHTYEIAQKLEENRERWTEQNRADIIAQYEKRIAEGFKYYAFGISSRFPSCEFVACCGVCREEKSADYKHAEKIKEEINKHIYKNNALSIYEVLELLKFINISIKRK